MVSNFIYKDIQIVPFLCYYYILIKNLEKDVFLLKLKKTVVILTGKLLSTYSNSKAQLDGCVFNLNQ